MTKAMEEIPEIIKRNWSLLSSCRRISHYAHLFPLSTILFFHCGSQFFRLSLKNGLLDCASELVFNQEKADTKVFLSTKQAEAFGVLAACISIVDLDIAIYMLYFLL